MGLRPVDMFGSEEAQAMCQVMVSLTFLTLPSRRGLPAKLIKLLSFFSVRRTKPTRSCFLESKYSPSSLLFSPSRRRERSTEFLHPPSFFQHRLQDLDPPSPPITCSPPSLDPPLLIPSSSTVVASYLSFSSPLSVLPIFPLALFGFCSCSLGSHASACWPSFGALNRPLKRELTTKRRRRGRARAREDEESVTGEAGCDFRSHLGRQRKGRASEEGG